MPLETLFQSAYCSGVIGSPDWVSYLFCWINSLLSVRSHSDEEIESLVFLFDASGRKFGRDWAVRGVH